MVQRNQKPDTGFKPSYEQSSRIVNRVSSEQRVNEVENTDKPLIYCKLHRKALLTGMLYERSRTCL